MHKLTAWRKAVRAKESYCIQRYKIAFRVSQRRDYLPRLDVNVLS
jgi:hypothetical protein